MSRQKNEYITHQSETISYRTKWHRILKYCADSYIHSSDNIFWFFFSLQCLMLDDNNISFIEELAFMNTSLAILHLNDNKLMKLPLLRTTSGASHLLRLSVNNNNISNITSDQVEPLSLLWYLEIRGNLLMELDFIRYIPALRSGYFSRNPFPSTEILSVEARNLKKLELENSELERFPLISGQRSFVREINLNSNKISRIDLVHLSNMTRLEKLHLGYNRIKTFPENGWASNNRSIYTTRDWWFPNLQHLFLRFNRLTEVPLLPDAGLFANEIKIDLSRNWISHVSVARLRLLKNGTNINLILSHNRITEMPYLGVVGPALLNAYLEGNQIAYLSQEHLIGLTNLKTLRLSLNRITSFDFTVVPKLPSLTLISFNSNTFSKFPTLQKELINSSLIITLENNPIICDEQNCSLVAEALKVLQLTCAAPEKHIGRTLAAYYLVMCGKYSTLIARFMGPTWGPSGADRTEVGPMLVPWTLLSGHTQHTI